MMMLALGISGFVLWAILAIGIYRHQRQRDLAELTGKKPFERKGRSAWDFTDE